MNSVKIIHTADCHLGSGRNMVQNGKNELITTFFRILDLCRKNDIDFLLIAGDLFDSPFADRDTVNEITSAIAGIPRTNVVIASGNHDCACSGSVYDTFAFPPNVHLFTSGIDRIDFPEKNTCIYGAGFSSSHCPQSLFDNFSAADKSMINIGVFHGELASSSLYNPISEARIYASQLDYLALGHIHKRSDVQKSGNTFYSYCGCIDGRGFDEDGSKGIYMGTVSKSTCQLEYIPLSSRLYITDRIDISGCSSSQNAAAAILEHIKKSYGDSFADNLYKLTLTGSIAPGTVLSMSRIQTMLSEYVQYSEIADCTQPDITDLESLAAQQSLRGVFTRKFLEHLDAATPDRQDTIMLALKTGLSAFEREVKLGED